MIKINQILAFLKKIIGNKVFNFIWPFFLVFIGYIFSNDEKKLSYYVVEKKDFIFNSNNQTIKTLKLSFFNDGNEIIDSSDFISESGISIKNSGKIKILKFEKLKSTRPELNLHSNIFGFDSSLLSLKLLNNEAFEINDVISIQIQYLIIKKGNWIINGRIKGIPKGITKGDKTPDEYEVIIITNIIWIILFIILLFRIILLKKYEKEFVIRKFEIGIIVLFIIHTVVIYYEYYSDLEILKEIKGL